MLDSRMKIPNDWTFCSSEVASHFDQHVREQLPWYDMITSVIVVIARHFIESGGIVYDIGCSTGNITKAIYKSTCSRNPHFIGIDESEDMSTFYPKNIGEFIKADACVHQYKPFDVAVCYLLFQFLPLKKRRLLIRSLIDKVKPSGAIILVDKFISPNTYCGTRDIFRRITLNSKLDNGVPAEEIVSKELSISGVQRPVNPDIITEESPLAFEFFKFGEFAGWIIPGSNE